MKGLRTRILRHIDSRKETTIYEISRDLHISRGTAHKDVTIFRNKGLIENAGTSSQSSYRGRKPFRSTLKGKKVLQVVAFMEEKGLSPNRLVTMNRDEYTKGLKEKELTEEDLRDAEDAGMIHKEKLHAPPPDVYGIGLMLWEKITYKIL